MNSSKYLLDAVVQGKTADVYFERTLRVLESNNINPIVDMEVFCKTDNAVICGIDEAVQLLRNINKPLSVWYLRDGSLTYKNRIVLRIKGHYQDFCLYETAYLGILSSGTGWATAARECVTAAKKLPVTSFGARHIHPNVAAQMDYAAIIGGCKAGSCILGGEYSGVSTSGTMPHALIISMTEKVKESEATELAACLYDDCMPPSVTRTVLVDTFRDEVEESIAVAKSFDRDGRVLHAVRLDTPSERGGVRVPLVRELRAKLDLAGFYNVKILVSGGFTPERIKEFCDVNAPVDGFGVGSYISGAKPIDFTADIHAVNNTSIAKRGRVPGVASHGDMFHEIW